MEINYKNFLTKYFETFLAINTFYALFKNMAYDITFFLIRTRIFYFRNISKFCDNQSVLTKVKMQ